MKKYLSAFQGQGNYEYTDSFLLLEDQLIWWLMEVMLFMLEWEIMLFYKLL